MRTTMTIDDDVLAAARALAAQQQRSLGDVVSGLARLALSRPMPQAARNGIALLPVSNPGAQVTLELVNTIRDEA